MRALVAFAIFGLLLVPMVSAQSIGTVRTWVEPEELTIEPFVFVNGSPQRNQQSFDVHVEGSIQCTPLTQAPLAVFVERNGTRQIEGTSGGETVVYFGIDVDNFTVAWESVSSTRYEVSAVVTVNVQSDGAPPQNLQAILDWPGALAEPGGTTRCNPQGYGWNIEAEPITITIPGAGSGGDPGTDEPGEPSNGTPLPVWLTLVALGLAFARRRTHE